MLQVCIIGIWSQGLILNSETAYTTFGTKIPVFRANSPFGYKMAKITDFINVSRIVKIVHSDWGNIIAQQLKSTFFEKKFFTLQLPHWSSLKNFISPLGVK